MTVNFLYWYKSLEANFGAKFGSLSDIGLAPSRVYPNTLMGFAKVVYRIELWGHGLGVDFR